MTLDFHQNKTGIAKDFLRMKRLKIFASYIADNMARIIKTNMKNKKNNLITKKRKHI